jgi:uncharacterized protein (TIGR03435 family)
MCRFATWSGSPTRFDLSEIKGGPEWIDLVSFDIIAKGSPDVSQPAMMRALLAERFALAAHHQTEAQPTYALALARTDGKPGPHLTPSTIDCAKAGACYRRSGPTHVEIRGRPLSESLRSLSALLGQTVVDRTGLAGPYDVTLNFSSEQLPGALRVPTPVDSSLPSIFTAVREQLGLELDAIRSEVTVLVIDRAEMPAPD